MARSLLLLTIVGVNSFFNVAQAASPSSRIISFPTSRPSDAVVVPADFVGFGFDAAFLNSYDNAFSNGLIESVANRTGVLPTIRIGGTSGDRFTFNPNQKQNTTCIGKRCPNGEGAAFILGPSYFEGFKSFEFAHMSFQAPLAGPNKMNITNTLDYVTRAYKSLGADRLAAIAIGNEPAGLDPTVSDYNSAASIIEGNVTQALGLNASNSKIFEVLDLSSNQVAQQKPWTLPQAFEKGLDDNGLVKFAAEHWYQNSGNYNVQNDLMDHSAITSQFQPYNLSLSYLNANNKKIPLVLSEVGSTLGGDYHYASCFGACMWSVDFQLFGMSQGLARIDMTGRPAATHSLWVPVGGLKNNPGPAVRANYVAQHFVAEFLGSSKGAAAAADTSVVEMSLQSNRLTAYGAYDGQSLARVALVNLNAWSAANGTTRSSQSFTITAPAGTKSVKLARLRSDSGITACGFDNGSDQNVTFAGQQWAYGLNSNGYATPSTQTLEITAVANGKVTVDVPDSEAVLVYLK